MWFCPTEHTNIRHPVLFYQFIELKEYTPYAPARIAKPSYPSGSKFLLQDVTPTLGLVTCTETVTKKAYCLHAFIHSFQNSSISGNVFRNRVKRLRSCSLKKSVKVFFILRTCVRVFAPVCEIPLHLLDLEVLEYM